MTEKKRTFDNDLLGRKAYADFLYSIIVNAENYKRIDESYAYVIAIDSFWGNGKTFFLDMFENYIKSSLDKKKIDVIRYNAWENDFWKDAFEPLICNITNDIILIDNQYETKCIEVINRIKAASFAIIKGYTLTKVKKTYGEEIAKLAEKGTDALLRPEKIVFKEYNELRRSIAELKKALRDYIHNNSKSESEKKLLIIIDELDRCKPTFAIETLEVVKHLFDVEGIVFMFAVDIEQLSNSVKSVYGIGINAYGYMGRFFDYISKMPPVESEEYVKIKLLKKIRFNSNLENKMKYIVEFVNIWWKIMKFSLRELDTLLENIKIMINYFLYKYTEIDAFYMYIFFLMLKYKHLEMFNTIFNYKENPEKIVEVFEVDKFWKDKLTILSPFWNNTPLQKHTFNFYNSNSNDEFFNGYFLKKENNILFALSKDGRSMEFECNLCSLNHILFDSDIEVWHEIQHKSFPQYVFEQLEMFQFKEKFE